MSEWKECKLKDIAEIQTGPFGSQLHKSDYVSVGVPCIMPTIIGSHLDLSTDGIARIKEEDAIRLSKHIVHTGDIVYARRGDIEKCAYIKDSQNGWFCGTGCLKVYNFKDNVLPLYIAYQLSTDRCKKLISKNAVGTTMPNLNTTILGDISLFVPQLQTQQNIASILSSLDDKIAVNRRICENLEAQAQALFKHWFIDFAPFKDGKFVESELGMIPEGWKVGKLSDLGDIICGKTPSKANKLYYGGNVPFIKIPDMHGNMFVINSEDNLSNEGSNSQLNKLIPEFSIMVSCIATVGLVSMNTKPSHTNQQINTIVPYVPSYRYYIYENLKLREKELLLLGSSGTTTYNVNTKTFSSLKILMPDLKVIEDFDKSIKYHFEETLNLYQENLRLSTLRDTLLPKLMSGQIKV